MISEERLKRLLWYLPEDIAKEKESTIQELQEELEHTKEWSTKYAEIAEMRLADIHDLQAETDRLNRIMPHTGETCKHQMMESDLLCVCDKEKNLTCEDHMDCFNKKWELKE